MISESVPPSAVPIQAQDYRAYFDEIPCLVTILDRELRIVGSNRQFRESYGDRAGARCHEVYKCEPEKCPQCLVEETFITGKGKRGEETFLVRETGQPLPVIVYTAPIRDGGGRVDRVLKVSADITEVRALQRKLHKTQQRLGQLFNEVPCYISVQDRELRVTDANRRFREDFGDEIGRRCFEIYKHREEPCLRCPVAETFADGRSHQSEEVVTSIAGEQVNVLVQTAPIRDSEGGIAAVVEMSTNISELRRLQSQLTSLGLLVGSISHGIKGVLAALDGGMYIVNSGFKRHDQARVEQGWQIVQRNVAQIRRMVLDILYYAKDRELQTAPIPAGEFFRDVASKLEPKAAELGVAFNAENALEAPVIEGDEDALRSALVNILENALDACRVDARKETHAVSFRMEGRGDQVCFEVADNGIGMDRETQEKVFSLFFSSKGNEGTGLGLFISNKIIKEHGGRIDLTSRPGEGARFTIRIPRGIRQDSIPGQVRMAPDISDRG